MFYVIIARFETAFYTGTAMLSAIKTICVAMTMYLPSLKHDDNKHPQTIHHDIYYYIMVFYSSG